jgi:hypothetical protein
MVKVVPASVTIVPPGASRDVARCVVTSFVVCKVPPAKVRPPAAAPRLPSAEISRIPASRRVPPV